MSAASLTQPEPGRVEVHGELSFDTVPALVEPMRKILAERDHVAVDLAAVSRGDSAGVALLVEWMNLAERLQKSIAFLNIPQQMLSIARVSSLDQMLPLARN